MSVTRSSAALLLLLSWSLGLDAATNKCGNDLIDLDTPAVSEACRRDYKLFYDARCGIGEPENRNWALKMADAYGSWPIEGELEGNRYSLGSYYSCMELEVNPAPGEDFRGQYCHAVSFISGREILDGSNINAKDRLLLPRSHPLAPPFPDGLDDPLFQFYALGLSNQGICVPSSCSIEDIYTGLWFLGTKHLSTVVDNGTVTLLRNNFILLTCDSRGQKPDLTAGDIAFISLIAFMVVAMIIGTAYDWRVMELKKQGKPSPIKNEKLKKLLVGFSLYSNTKKLMDTKVLRGQISCLNGIRFLSMTWVLLTHTLSMLTFALPVQNKPELNNEFQSGFNFRVILNGFPSVDSFFLLSGCLLGYLTFKEMDKRKGRLNWFFFYLHRYLRLTLVYAVVIGFFATIYKYFHSGVTNFVSLTVQGCVDTWWRNILYITNFATDDGSCVGQGWYLSTEMQMFICTPFLLIPMYHINKRYGLRASLLCPGILLLGFTSLSLGMSVTHDWPVNASADPGGSDYFDANYVMPWHRCQPYIVGIALGMILHVTKNTEVKMKRWFAASMWVLAFAVGIGVVYGPDPWGYSATQEYPSVVACAFYNGYHRMAWGMGLAWMIFACFHGYGGFIDSFLSWKLFIPLGRLSFHVYLVHYALISLIMSQVTFSVYATQLLGVFFILVVFIISNAFALILALVVEMPLITAEKLLVG